MVANKKSPRLSTAAGNTRALNGVRQSSDTPFAPIKLKLNNIIPYSQPVVSTHDCLASGHDSVSRVKLILASLTEAGQAHPPKANMKLPLSFRPMSWSLYGVVTQILIRLAARFEEMQR